MNDAADQPLPPYQTPSGEARVRSSYCVYADVLGFTAEVRALKGPSALAKFLSRLRAAIGEANQYIQLAEPDDDLPALGAMRSFTDNIVLGFPADDDDDTESSFGTTVGEIIPFQLSMVLSGFFIRGGMSIGNLYMGSKIVFGEAILDAYEAEQAIAVHPRIVLTQAVAKEVEKHLGYYADDYPAPQKLHVLRDADGQLFLNYLSAVLGDGEVDWSTLEKHKAIVEEKLAAYALDARVREKYLWAATYHDMFCDSVRSHRGFSQDLMISEALTSRAPRMLSGGRERT